MDFALANSLGLTAETIGEFAGYAVRRIAPLRDHRTPVIYPFAMVDYIGHYLEDAHQIRSLFPIDRYQVFWLCPPARRPLNREMIALGTQGIRLVEVDDVPESEMIRLGCTVFHHSWAFTFGDVVMAFGGGSRGIREQFHRHITGGGPIRPLQLTEAQEAEARRHLASIEVEPGDRFAVLHVRESGYNARETFNDWRNSDIRNYEKGVRRVTEAGIKIVRIGDATMRPVPWGFPGFIDLTSHADRNPAIDGYAIATCDLIIHTFSGPFSLGRMFGKPLLGLNGYFSDYLMPEPSGWLWLPKRYVSDGHSLGLAEILNRRLTRVIMGDQLKRAGVEFQENTPDEIDAACRQFLSGASSSWQASYEALNRKETELRRDPTGPLPEHRYWGMDVPGARIADAVFHHSPALLAGELIPPRERGPWPPA